MLFVENPNTNPYINHALEEWLIHNMDDECFMLWRNQRAILLGRNQNIWREVNLPYAQTHGIHIVRRITGGGTVFTDEGNLMFSFIAKTGLNDFAYFTRPILHALQELSVPAEFSGRNDLMIEGRKFSGNAQCQYAGKVLHHGTLMLAADTGEMAKALTVRPLKLQAKGVKSVRSRVTNINNYLSRPMDVETFRSYLTDHVRTFFPSAKDFRLSPEQWSEVRDQAKQKHATDGWIYGQNPPFSIQREKYLPGGLVEGYLNVQMGHIAQVKLYGDFFGDGDIRDIEDALLGIAYEQSAIERALVPFDLSQYCKNISAAQLAAVLV